MASIYLWKLSSQKLGFFLVSFGFIWGMMLLHFTIQQRMTHESSAQLRVQILDLSKRYIKALAEENQGMMDGPYVGTMTAYDQFLKVLVFGYGVDVESCMGTPWRHFHNVV
ncbi:alpha-1,6-mannosylglycoprotein 6-beta-N-acetylglucosaminyltransferase A [Tachysurus ichikawai]